MRRSYPDPTRFIFSIPKLVLSKKLNRAGRGGAGIRKFPNPSHLHLIFVFIFYFLYFFIFAFYFYYIKINIFHKNKNIINFYKFFIKKHSNYYYYLY